MVTESCTGRRSLATQLVLVIGDMHIPQRAHDLPQKFSKLLSTAQVPGKIQQILCTGNVCDRSTYDHLRTVAADLHVVKGDMDERCSKASFPATKVIQHGALRVGLLHGHQVIPWGDSIALSMAAREMDADILISGHTHQVEAIEREGRFYVNPGSATGAFNSTSGSDSIPSFVLMDIQNTTAVTYIYQLIDGEVKVEKIEYRKDTRA
ncbi:putative vacuolar protein sorting 29 [Thamnocephalis sphaerospora]|uniref:Vacuolar protein sorting-associated protein 29 n=1 Tax=Thamnocephalis sphaerospora TaxID=78915 RepID=A0A4P9XU85_9FUNG|nr:putative vacuolar protein sorting 29 [Thamnocephalis sphaerospora]|eukprot:RKP09777.1 putative vacuolar protein sorting 29 [Thamnocephalis sphaerospora]